MAQSNDIITSFHAFYKGHHLADGSPPRMRWRGVELLKMPTDVWVYQELLVEEKFDVIVEGGTVHIDGKAQRSCVTPVSSLQGRDPRLSPYSSSGSLPTQACRAKNRVLPFKSLTVRGNFPALVRWSSAC